MFSYQEKKSVVYIVHISTLKKKIVQTEKETNEMKMYKDGKTHS